MAPLDGGGSGGPETQRPAGTRLLPLLSARRTAMGRTREPSET